MRSFICACIILFILIALTAVNSVALGRELTRLEKLTSELPDRVCEVKSDDIEHIESGWGKHRELIALTIDAELIRETDELLLGLRSALQTEDSHGFLRTRMLLCELFGDLRELGSFSISQIF